MLGVKNKYKFGCPNKEEAGTARLASGIEGTSDSGRWWFFLLMAYFETGMVLGRQITIIPAFMLFTVQ